MGGREIDGRRSSRVSVALREFGFLFLCIWCLHSSRAAGQEALGASLVQLQIVADGKPQNAQGVVVADGKVLTLFSRIASATEIKATAGDRSGTCTEVAHWVQPFNIAFLTIAWQGEPPPALALCSEAPPPGIEIKFHGQVAEDVTVTVNELRALDFLVSWNGSLDAGLGGSVLLRDGCLCGIVTGAQATQMPDGATTNPRLVAARPELIHAPSESKGVPLDKWAEVSRQIDEAVRHATAARAAYEADDIAAALQSAARSVKIDQRSVEGWAVLGAALLVKQEPAGALSAIDRAIHLFPTQPTFWSIKADAHMRLGQDEQAIEAARRAASIDPRFRDCVAWALSSSGDHDAAAAELHEAERVFPEQSRTPKEAQRLQHIRKVIKERTRSPLRYL
jgi:Flp pilus assembly protein TadD